MNGNSATTVSVNGNRATFTTGTMTAEVADGAVTRLFNRITGTDYIPVGRPPQAGFRTAALYLEPGVDSLGDSAMLPAPLALQELGTPDSRGTRDGIEYRYEGKHDVSLSIAYRLDPSSGDLVVSQSANGSHSGMSGVRFGLGPILCRGNLLLPAWEGIKAKTKGEYLHWEGASWDWPFTWSLQFIVFDDVLGGLWIHGEDSELHFKKLHYDYAGDGRWYVAFDTENLAPLENHTSAASIEWRINVYEGDWQVPVDRFKTWAYSAYNIDTKTGGRPDWVDDIKLQIKHADYIPEEQIEDYLDLIAEHADPNMTLLFMTEWYERANPVIFPNWKVNDKGITFNREAHRRGFRTVYFANYWAITPTHPRFQEFRPFCIRNPYSGQHEGWCIRPEHFARQDRETFLELYYVNPASRAWRDFQVSEFASAFDTSPADGLFLDQNYVVYNDMNGAIDGMSILEGNLALHAALVDALPGVALAGENVNEISFQYEAFFELHPFSFELVKDEDGRHRWRIDPEAFDRMVPMLSRFCLPRTRPIGYLGYPETSSSHYYAWRDAVALHGGVPTITRPTIEELRDEDGEVRRVFRRALSG